MKRRFLAGALTALALSFVPVSTASADVDVHAMTLNIHGGYFVGDGGNNGNVQPITSQVLSLVANNHLEVFGLQEVCKTQHDAIKKALASKGWYATMTYTMGPTKACKGTYFGNSLFIKSSNVLYRTSYALPWGQNPVGTPGHIPRRMVCANATLSDGVYYRICVTHFAVLDPDRRNQYAYVQPIVQRERHPMIFLCDCNATIDMPRTWYPQLNWSGGKIDFIGVSKPQEPHTVSRVVPASDHPAILGAW